MASAKFKALVIVESPTKAKKIGGYLGKDYKVLASVGHVRDLPAKAAEVPEEIKKEPWATLGINVHNQFAPLYIIPDGKKKLIRELKSALKDCDELLIATDEDREGESIGWHLVELLQPKVPVKRMVFGEITKSAILNAVQHTRDIDQNLVQAQETRRVVDRLYGYTLSPLLWKKVARGLSAGRVQSVAVRMLVTREYERQAFRKANYWDLKATLQTPRSESFVAELAGVAGRRIASGKDFDESTGKLKPGADVVLMSDVDADQLRSRIASGDWVVEGVESRPQTRRPYAPFTTSTLQQESNRKLGMTARQTMQTAQRLYEDGHITYMRTDSVTLSGEAISAARKSVKERYGDDYLSPEVRQYTTKAKGAQEAHEAIRPAGTDMKTGEELGLDGNELRLYALIWKRTMATQMAEARLTFQTAIIKAGDAEFRATGRHVDFPGFFRAYVEGVDDPEAAMDDSEKTLPLLNANDRLKLDELEPVSHETKPPARFTEATLVDRLEKEGIGRPSTYSSIIGTIQDRGYVVKQGNQLVPTFTAMAVTQLLEQHFSKLVDYSFTAQMEQTLDDVASGEADRQPYLEQFYLGEEGLESQVQTREGNIDPREACTIRLKDVSTGVRVGKYGPFLSVERDGKQVSVSLPNDIAPAELTDAMAQELIERKAVGPQSMGLHPDDGRAIYKKIGPYGPYLQLGEDNNTKDDPKPKRVSLPKGVSIDSVSFDDALKYLTLPRNLGNHPEKGTPVTASIGPYGPYVECQRVFKSIGKAGDVLTIELAQAVELLSQAKQRAGATPIKELGAHPDDGEPIGLYEGRYGPYVKHGKTIASVPKETPIESVTLETALPWIAAKAGTTKKGGRKKAAGSKKKSSTKKAAGKKSATKKAARKKKAAEDKTEETEE